MTIRLKFGSNTQVVIDNTDDNIFEEKTGKTKLIAGQLIMRKYGIIQQLFTQLLVYKEFAY